MRDERGLRLERVLLGVDAEVDLRARERDDRVQRLCFDNGPLAPKVAAERYCALAESIQKAIPAEAARWGTYRRDVHPYKTGPYERYSCEEHWQKEVSRILNAYFLERLGFLLDQFRERGLFPSTPK